MSIDDFAQIRLPVEGRNVQLCQESLGAVAMVTQCSWQQRQKIKAGFFFPLIDIYTQMPHWLLLLTVMTPRGTTLLGGSTRLHTITDRCTSLNFQQIFEQFGLLQTLKLFMIHVLKRLIMLKIMLQSGSCFFVTLCCKKQQDYSIALTFLLSRQSLTWKESCRWASVTLWDSLNKTSPT